jgi:hypothetical protein
VAISLNITLVCFWLLSFLIFFANFWLCCFIIVDLLFAQAHAYEDHEEGELNEEEHYYTSLDVLGLGGSHSI